MMSSGNVNANGNTNGNTQKMTMEELAERLAGIYVGKEYIREKEAQGKAETETETAIEKSPYIIGTNEIARWFRIFTHLPKKLSQKVKDGIFQAKQNLAKDLSKEDKSTEDK